MKRFWIRPGSACRVGVYVHPTVVTWGFSECEAVTMDSVSGKGEGRVIFVGGKFYRWFAVVSVR